MAKRFQFRLEAVLRVRREAQEAQQRQVAEAVRALTDVETSIEVMARQMRESLLSSAGDRAESLLSVSALCSGERFRGWLHRKILEGTAQAGDLRARLEVERQKLADVRRQTRVIETLREQRWKKYVEWSAREEQRDTDEAAAQQWLQARRRVQGRGAA
jgi:flagellar FliJ protein